MACGPGRCGRSGTTVTARRGRFRGGRVSVTTVVLVFQITLVSAVVMRVLNVALVFQ